MERLIPKDQALASPRTKLGKASAKPLLHLGARREVSIRTPGEATRILEGIHRGRHLVATQVEVGVRKAFGKIIKEIVNEGPAFLPCRVKRVGRRAKGLGKAGGNGARRALGISEEQGARMTRKV